LGAIVVNFAKTWFTGAMPELWLFVLGGMFVVVTVSLPKGIVGIQFYRDKLFQHKPKTLPTPSSSEASS
jgi:urea transport system permease protein